MNLADGFNLILDTLVSQFVTYAAAGALVVGAWLAVRVGLTWAKRFASAGAVMEGGRVLWNLGSSVSRPPAVPQGHKDGGLYSPKGERMGKNARRRHAREGRAIGRKDRRRWSRGAAAFAVSAVLASSAWAYDVEFSGWPGLDGSYVHTTEVADEFVEWANPVFTLNWSLTGGLGFFQYDGGTYYFNSGGWIGRAPASMPVGAQIRITSPTDIVISGPDSIEDSVGFDFGALSGGFAFGLGFWGLSLGVILPLRWVQKLSQWAS